MSPARARQARDRLREQLRLLPAEIHALERGDSRDPAEVDARLTAGLDRPR